MYPDAGRGSSPSFLSSSPSFPSSLPHPVPSFSPSSGTPAHQGLRNLLLLPSSLNSFLFFHFSATFRSLSGILLLFLSLLFFPLSYFLSVSLSSLSFHDATSPSLFCVFSIIHRYRSCVFFSPFVFVLFFFTDLFFFLFLPLLRPLFLYSFQWFSSCIQALFLCMFVSSLFSSFTSSSPLISFLPLPFPPWLLPSTPLRAFVNFCSFSPLTKNGYQLKRIKRRERFSSASFHIKFEYIIIYALYIQWLDGSLDKQYT